MVTFTVAQIIALVLAVAGGVTCLSSAAKAIYEWIKIVKRPMDDVEDRVENVERLVEKHDDELKELKDSNRIAQKALLALLSHGIDGNDVAMMKDAKRELQSFLIDK